MNDPAPGLPPTAGTASRRPFSVGGPFSRWEWAVFGAITLLYVLVVVLAVRRGPPLGWDEAVYSVRARDFADGISPRHYWDSIRAPGLPWMLHLLWGVGGQATVFRLTVAGFGLGLVAVTWLLARHLFGCRSGLVAAAGVALTPPLVLAATQVWPDIPGAAIGLLAISIFVFATGGERPSWWMTALVPVAAAATLLRYGAPLPIAVALLVVAAWRRRVLLRRPALVIVTALGATAAVLAVLTVSRLTGASSSPLGEIPIFARGWSAGLADYAHLIHLVAGPAAVVLALAGAVAVFGWAKQEGIDRGALVAVLATGFATALGLALVLHGEVRYLAPAYPWLWVMAAPGLERLGRSLPRAMRPATVAVVVLALAAAAVGTARERNRSAGTEYTTVRRAAEFMAAQAGGRPCLVVASRVPQVMWYSGCEAVAFDLREVRLPVRQGTVTFLLIIGGDRRQPEGDLLAAYRAAGNLTFAIEGRRPAEIYLVREPPPGG